MLISLAQNWVVNASFRLSIIINTILCKVKELKGDMHKQ